MDDIQVFEFYQFLQKHDVMLSFKGDISQEILVSLGDLLKEKVFTENAQQRVAQKVFFIFIELAQNICRYSSARSMIAHKQVGTGVLVIQEFDTYYGILAGNIVAVSEAADIAERCATLNKLGQEELKRLYKEQLKQPREQDKIGGNVGLIGIVRKAGKPLEVQTTVIDNERTFLVLSVHVDKK